MSRAGRTHYGAACTLLGRSAPRRRVARGFSLGEEAHPMRTCMLLAAALVATLLVCGCGRDDASVPLAPAPQDEEFSKAEFPNMMVWSGPASTATEAESTTI